MCFVDLNIEINIQEFKVWLPVPNLKFTFIFSLVVVISPDLYELSKILFELGTNTKEIRYNGKSLPNYSVCIL